MTDNFQRELAKNVWLSDVFRLIAKSVDHIPEDADVNVNGEIYNCREALCAYLSVQIPIEIEGWHNAVEVIP